MMLMTQSGSERRTTIQIATRVLAMWQLPERDKDTMSPSSLVVIRAMSSFLKLLSAHASFLHHQKYKFSIMYFLAVPVFCSLYFAFNFLKSTHP